MGDEVVLSTEKLRINCPPIPQKIKARWIDSFRITKEVSRVAFELDLPSHEHRIIVRKSFPQLPAAGYQESQLRKLLYFNYAIFTRSTMLAPRSPSGVHRRETRHKFHSICNWPTSDINAFFKPRECKQDNKAHPGHKYNVPLDPYNEGNPTTYLISL